jgi:hypothetical protein
MYRFYYGYLKNKFGDKVTLLQTDTDSFTVYVETEDFYEDMKQDMKHFDTSYYPDDFPIDMPKANKKIPGLFKEEFSGKLIREFVGLK